LAEVREYAQGPKVVAIGEIGLDYYEIEVPDGSSEQEAIAKQKQLFAAQLDLAKELDLPVVLHIRDSYEDVYDIVKDRGLRGVVHCFSGNLEQAQKFLDIGYMISFTGVITFPKTKDLQEVIKNIPLEKIMLETDAPFLAPQRVRGERCEPAFVKDVAEHIALTKNLTLEEVASQTTKNAQGFFKI